MLSWMQPKHTAQVSRIRRSLLRNPIASHWVPRLWQKTFAHLLSYLPTSEGLIKWMFGLYATHDQIMQSGMDDALENHPRVFNDLGERNGFLRRQRMPFAEDDREGIGCHAYVRAERFRRHL